LHSLSTEGLLREFAMLRAVNLEMENRIRKLMQSTALMAAQKIAMETVK